MATDTKRLDAVIDVFKVRPEHRRPKRIGKQIDIYRNGQAYDVQVNGRVVAANLEKVAADAKVADIKALCDRTGVSYVVQEY